MRTLTGPSSGIVHLELHTAASGEAARFLRQLFGWRSEVVGSTSTVGAYRALGLGDRVGGGIVECGQAQAQWVPYVMVDDVDGAVALARQLGAKVLLDPREGPAGRRSVISTPASGVIALWQLRALPPDRGRP